MRRSLRTFVTAMVALAAAFGATTPAVAASGPPPYKVYYYEWLTCPEGTATTGTITSANTLTSFEDVTLYHVFVDGVLTSCRQPWSNDAFALAGYRSTSAYGFALAYGDNHALTRDYSHFLRIYPDVQAVCLIADETTRLACIAIDWVTVSGESMPVVGAPLPTDSPLVDMPAVTSLRRDINGPGGPTCFKCGG